MARRSRPYRLLVYHIDDILAEALKTEVKELASDLRPQDKADLIAACGDVETAINQSIAFSDTVYVFINDKNKCFSMLGIGTVDGSAIGRSIWSVSANDINNGYVKTVLFKLAREIIKEWVDKAGMLHNVVHAENKTSIHYMEKVLGAVFLPETFIANGHEWKPFYIIPKKGGM